MTTGDEVWKTLLQPVEHLLREHGELRTAMIDRRLRDRAQHAVGHVGRPGNLKKMPPALGHA